MVCGFLFNVDAWRSDEELSLRSVEEALTLADKVVLGLDKSPKLISLPMSMN